MKTVKIFLLALLPFIFSCNPDADRFQPTQTYGIIDANLGGYTWSASTGYAQYQNFSLTLSGSAPDGSSLLMTIYPYNGLGTYQANSPAQFSFFDVDGYEYYATTGSISITSENSGQVQGNFYFSGVSNGGAQPIDMSGSFNLYY